MSPIRHLCRGLAIALAALTITGGISVASDDCTFSCANLPGSVSYGANFFTTVGATSSPPTEAFCSISNGGHIYNDIWVSFVPICSGLHTITTCGGAGFDTVLALYPECPFHTVDGGGGTLFCVYDNNEAITCSDDFTGCGTQSTLTFNASAGQFYLVRVGAYTSGVTGAGTLTITGPVCTPPTARLEEPDELECMCVPLAIEGVADAAPGVFDRYTIESRPTGGGGPWNLLFTGVSPVSPSGPLYTWSDNSLLEGYYEVRLTVRDDVGATSSDEVVVYLNRGYDTVDLRVPVVYNSVTGDGIYGGRICIDGTVYDGCAGRRARCA